MNTKHQDGHLDPVPHCGRERPFGFAQGKPALLLTSVF